MKICWDMLEGVCLTKNGNFKKNCAVYVYRETCKICGEPYLSVKSRNSGFCSRECVVTNRKSEGAYNFKDLTGRRFGRLIVVKDAGRYRKKQALWLCRCDCGNEKTIRACDLKSLRTTSCGCRMRELASKRAKGKPKSKEQKRKQAAVMAGRTLTEEHRLKVIKTLQHGFGENNTMFGRCGSLNSFYKHGLTGTKAYNNAKSARRRGIKLNQTPDNSDSEKIRRIYKLCSDMNDRAKHVTLPKIPHNKAWFHVDHVIPLDKGGLHHENNLQILWWTDNLTKHTKILEGKEK